MTFSEFVEDWATRNDHALRARASTFRVQRFNQESDKPSIQVLIEGRDNFIDLIVWDSGEAEFGFGRRDQPTRDQHHEFASPHDTSQLLEGILEKIAHW